MIKNKPRKLVNLLVLSPPGWKVVLLKNINKTYIYAYSNEYYLRYRLNSDVLNFKVVSKYGLRLYFYGNKSCNINFFKTIVNVFNNLIKPLFRKISFKGKGYYIFKNSKQTVTTQFGHSHRVYLYLFCSKVIFLSKTRILIFGLSNKDVFTNSKKILSTKPINIFTGRGVRFNKQVVFKKTGKVSTYK